MQLVLAKSARYSICQWNIQNHCSSTVWFLLWYQISLHNKLFWMTIYGHITLQSLCIHTLFMFPSLICLPSLLNSFGSPWRIVDDCGGAFTMGAIGGGVFQSIKGFRNAPAVSSLRNDNNCYICSDCRHFKRQNSTVLQCFRVLDRDWEEVQTQWE